SSWVDVDLRNVTATSDTTVVITVTDPAPYISATGEVLIKVWMGGAGKTVWNHHIDFVKITASP
ncbi:MAG: hypothetical protein JXA57_18575, partial [Armatimonadetes bacterium]|nr:hypothetical protein [Armatimonadota bacterium]